MRDKHDRAVQPPHLHKQQRSQQRTTDNVDVQQQLDNSSDSNSNSNCIVVLVCNVLM